MEAVKILHCKVCIAHDVNGEKSALPANWNYILDSVSYHSQRGGAAHGIRDETNKKFCSLD